MSDWFRWAVLAVVFLLLWGAFFGLLLYLRQKKALNVAARLAQNALEGVDVATKKRLRTERRELLLRTKKAGFLSALEQRLWYAGIKLWFPAISAEGVLALLLFGSFLAGSLAFVVRPLFGLLAFLGIWFCFWLILEMLRALNLRRTAENLIKCLDFLANYSLTSGEVSTVLGQVARYVEEPLAGILRLCALEAQTDGDVSLALLLAAERLEHPKFKELMQNLEISLRYTADLTALANATRRSVAEYLRAGTEEKTILREAFVNLSILCLLSVVCLWVVDSLISAGIWELLFFTTAGRLALGGVCSLLAFFGVSLFRLQR